MQLKFLTIPLLANFGNPHNIYYVTILHSNSNSQFNDTGEARLFRLQVALFHRDYHVLSTEKDARIGVHR